MYINVTTATENIAQLLTIANIEKALGSAGFVTIHDDTYECTIKVERVGGYTITDSTGGEWNFLEGDVSNPLAAAVKAVAELSGYMVEADDSAIDGWEQVWSFADSL